MDWDLMGWKSPSKTHHVMEKICWFTFPNRMEEQEATIQATNPTWGSYWNTTARKMWWSLSRKAWSWYNFHCRLMGRSPMSPNWCLARKYHANLKDYFPMPPKTPQKIRPGSGIKKHHCSLIGPYSILFPLKMLEILRIMFLVLPLCWAVLAS